MWGKLADLAKLGDQIGEVIQKAKDDVEKSIDNTLGIDATSQKPSQSASETRALSSTSQTEASARENNDPTNASNPTEGTEKRSKVVKKVVRKTVKRTEKSSSASASTDVAVVGDGTIPVAPVTTPASSAPEQLEHLEISTLPSSESPPQVLSSIITPANGEYLASDKDEEHSNNFGKDQTVHNVASLETGDGMLAKGPEANAALEADAGAHSLERLLMLEKDELAIIILQLEQRLKLQEDHTQQQAEKLSTLHELVAQLQTRNEQLAMKGATLSEVDYEEVRAECEKRLAASERKVYALTKERDALRKNGEKLVESANTIKEKEEHIKQLMEEGEKLSRKQVDLEGILRKVRTQLSSTEEAKEKLAAKLATEEQSVEALKKAKARAERDAATALESAKAELAAQKEAYEEMLARVRSEQMDAEERVRGLAAEGASRKLRESEARCEALLESVSELRDALERQRQAATLREEMREADISDLERRCQAAEMRHQELASKLPEATRPLLRQIEAMQAAADAQRESWASAEMIMRRRAEEAEARAAISAEKEQLAAERIAVLTSRITSLDAVLNTTRAQVRNQTEELEASRLKLESSNSQIEGLRRVVAALEERLAAVSAAREASEAAHCEELAKERAMRAEMEADAAMVRRECERRVAEVEASLAERSSPPAGNSWMDRGSAPPAMAGPGYRWVLVKEGESAPEETREERKLPSSSNPSSLDGGALGRESGVVLPPLNTSTSFHGSGGASMASELESLRNALRTKTVEVGMLTGQVRSLQACQDRLAEELLRATTTAHGMEDVAEQLKAAKEDIIYLQAKYAGAVELLGEREEKVEELMADLKDVKDLYKDQIEFMVAQLAEMHSQRTHLTNSLPHPSPNFDSPSN